MAGWNRGALRRLDPFLGSCVFRVMSPSAPKKKPTSAPIAVSPSARPARPLARAFARRGLPTVAALLSACATLACAEAPGLELRDDHQESHVQGLGKGKVAPPDPTAGLPGFGGEEVVSPSENPPVVKGEMPAVKPVPPSPHPIAMPGGLKAPTLGTVTPYKPSTPIPPSTKHPKLGGDVPAVDPSI